MIKVFTRNTPSPFPVDAERGPSYSAAASFTAPCGVMSLSVSPQPVITVDKVDQKVIAVATSSTSKEPGKVFGLLMPTKLPEFADA